MNIREFLDSTYLKTDLQAGLSALENSCVVKKTIQEAIDENFKLVMIRPNWVSTAKEMIANANSNLQIGTVIDFPGGESSLEEKVAEAKIAIQNGADDLDFVCNYTAFKNGELSLIKNEIYVCTHLGLENGKVVKWIIEVAALNDNQIIELSSLIKEVITSNFDEKYFPSVFVKSSTGFYNTVDNLPNGATIHTISLMIKNAAPLPVKAAGGVRTYQEAVAMLDLGVKRIGTSGAKAIVNGQEFKSNY